MAAETLELRDPPAAERARLVGRIIRNLTRLERLVTNLLDAARLEEGSLALHSEAVSLQQVLTGVLAELRDRAEQAVHLELDIDDAPAVRADPEAVRIVARNLLENAFIAVAGVDEARVTLAARDEGRRVVLEVRDNGRGFAPHEAERLFEKFYRPGDEMRRGGRGAGLGLYLVRELLRLQGGEIEGSSGGSGAGARFRASWPRADED
jgi:signal transduction histidine kinase